MTVRTQFWTLIGSWIIGGAAIGGMWVGKMIGDSGFELLIFALMITVGAFNFWLIRCQQCGTSAYFVRRGVYRGWPQQRCRKCGHRIM